MNRISLLWQIALGIAYIEGVVVIYIPFVLISIDFRKSFKS